MLERLVSDWGPRQVRSLLPPPPRGIWLRRHPGDVVRVLVGGSVVALGAALIVSGRGEQLGRDLFLVVNNLPDGGERALRPIMWLATVPAVGGLAAGALVLTRRVRPALDIAVAGVAAPVVGTLIRRLVGRGRPPVLVDEATVRAVIETQLAYPSGHTSIAATLAAAVSPFLPRTGRRIVWGWVTVVAVGRLYLGVHLPLDVVGGAALGLALGGALHLAVGAPGGEIVPETVRRWLDEAGLGPAQVARVVSDARSSFPFLATTPQGPLFVKTAAREHRNADFLWKLWRRAIYRGVEDEAAFATSKQQLEHEAAVSMLAERQGARTPAVVTLGTLGGGAALLVQEAVPDARGIDSLAPEEVDDELLADLWRQIVRLHEARIAHRDLKGPNLLIDDQQRTWVVDLGFAQLDASEERRARDVAELLASLSPIVGPERSVRAAASQLTHEQLAAAVPYLYPPALTAPTRQRMRSQPGQPLRELREHAAAAAGVEPADRAPVTRVQPRTMVTLLTALLSVYVLLPQVTELSQIRAALSGVSWPPLVLALLVALARYPLAAVQQAGGLPATPPIGLSSLAQLAASYANRITPAGIGGMALRERFLERFGFDRLTAMTSVGLVQVAGSIVHVIAMVVLAAVLGDLTLARLQAPPGTAVLIAVVVLTVGMAALLHPLPRRRGLAALRKGTGALAAVLHRPRRAVLLFTGAAGVLAANILVLVLCLQAFDSQLAISQIVLVFLAGSAVATAAPTPSGLGVLEATLVAGLTAVGASAGVAVSGVLTMRLLTFWFPIAPGFLAIQMLRRRNLL